MNPSNIGERIWELLYKTSEGLQGRGRSVEQELSYCDEQIRGYQESLGYGGIIIDGTVHQFREGGREDYKRGLEGWKNRKQKVLKGGQKLIAKEQRYMHLNLGDTVQNAHFLIFTEQRYKPAKGKRRPYTQRKWEYVPGVYDVKTWYSRQDIIDHCKKQGLALPPIAYYEKIQELLTVHQERGRAASDANTELEARLNELGISHLDFEDIKRDNLARKLDSAYKRLHEQEQIAHEDLDRVRDLAVLVFRGLDESQIHFYGNRPGNIPSNYATNVTPLTAKNLGEELHYAFAEFLRNNPNGANGTDLSPHNVPFVLQGRNGIYAVRLGDVRGPLVFRDLSLTDIKDLMK